MVTYFVLIRASAPQTAFKAKQLVKLKSCQGWWELSSRPHGSPSSRTWKQRGCMAAHI